MAIASPQKDLGSLNSSSIVFARVDNVWFIYSAKPFCSGVYGADVSCSVPLLREPYQQRRRVGNRLEEELTQSHNVSKRFALWVLRKGFEWKTRGFTR